MGICIQMALHVAIATCAQNTSRQGNRKREQICNQFMLIFIAENKIQIICLFLMKTPPIFLIYSTST